jgi:hypothetical protein
MPSLSSSLIRNVFQTFSGPIDTSGRGHDLPCRRSNRRDGRPSYIHAGIEGSADSVNLCAAAWIEAGRSVIDGLLHPRIGGPPRAAGIRASARNCAAVASCEARGGSGISFRACRCCFRARRSEGSLAASSHRSRTRGGYPSRNGGEPPGYATGRRRHSAKCPLEPPLKDSFPQVFHIACDPHDIADDLLAGIACGSELHSVGIDVIDRIVSDIGVQIELIVIADRIDLHEPPQRRRVEPGL